MLQLREIQGVDVVHAALPANLRTLCDESLGTRVNVLTGRRITPVQDLRLSITCDICYDAACRHYEISLAREDDVRSTQDRPTDSLPHRHLAGGPTVVSFINYKGGVGKTTTAYHVSCSLAQHHRQKVLMIDIDPQTNLTFLCAHYEKWQRRKRSVGTIKHLYSRFIDKDRTLDVSRFIWNDAVVTGRFAISGLDLIPCDIDLLGEDLGGGQVLDTYQNQREFRQDSQRYLKERSFLTNVIEDVRDRYDWVVIDCPPNLYLMTQNALHTSDYYVVTLPPNLPSILSRHQWEETQMRRSSRGTYRTSSKRPVSRRARRKYGVSSGRFTSGGRSTAAWRYPRQEAEGAGG